MKPANNAPTYLALYHGLAEIARKHGYAMAVHGTVGRDFDLICIFGEWAIDLSFMPCRYSWGEKSEIEYGIDRAAAKEKKA